MWGQDDVDGGEDDDDDVEKYFLFLKLEMTPDSDNSIHRTG